MLESFLISLKSQSEDWDFLYFKTTCIVITIGYHSFINLLVEYIFMPKKRADKKKNVSKVAKELVKNPNASEREIAKNTWVSKSSVNRAKTEMGQTGAKDKTIIDITNKDIKIVKLAQSIIEDKLNDKEAVKWMRITDVSKVAADSEKRYSIFRWSVTDQSWGLKGFENLSDSELVKLLEGNNG